jgi:hypothetical protein
MLAFVRGPLTFFGPGQVYVKILPDGEPVQLTNDSLQKMSPVFSPDGARIAYTTVVEDPFQWDTWTVPVLGGEPQLMLRNASGLVWTGPRQVLFSEIKMDVHMGIEAAEESRIGQHDVYLPTHHNGMAHRSYASPDGKALVIVETKTEHGCLAAWFTPTVVPQTARSGRWEPAAPSAHGLPMANGCTSPPTRAEPITYGGNVFRTGNPNRSLPGRPGKKASRWRPTASPLSRQWE